MSERLFTPRFIALWSFQLVVFFSAFQLLPAIPFRILELGGSKAAAGSFLFVYTFASALAAPITGTIADHFGRRRMLILASVLFIFFSLAYGVIPYIPLLLAVGVIHGALWSGILSSASAIMAGFIPPSRRTEGLGYWGLAPTVAFSIAPAVGLAVYRAGGWFWLCVELSVISVIMAIWASRLPVVDESRGAELPNLREAWDWRVIAAALSQTVTAFGYGGITSYAAILANERGIVPDSLYFTVFAVTVIAVRILTSRVADRYPPKAMIYFGYVAMPLAYATLAIAETRVMIAVSATLFGLGMGIAFPAFMTFVLTYTDERHRARTMGSLIWAFDTGIGIGSLLIGRFGQRWSLGTAFGIAAALALLAIPIFALTSRRLIRGTDVAPAVEHAGTT
ncbi:MAG TPA: MFS transporter [Thermoanaerobaculia bacterium]